MLGILVDRKLVGLYLLLFEFLDKIQTFMDSNCQFVANANLNLGIKLNRIECEQFITSIAFKPRKNS